MAAKAFIRRVESTVQLVVNGEATREFWCYGWPNALPDFRASGIRICQFDVPAPSWWTGPDTYDFSRLDECVQRFAAEAPEMLLIPRVFFGYQGERWWGELHPEELSVGLKLDGTPLPYLGNGAARVECWPSAFSRLWLSEASRALRAFVRHVEERYADRIIGYQVGNGITTEWFRWWGFIEDCYEDYSPRAREGFRRFLRRRYRDDAALSAAWGRPVRIDEAEVPPPARLHAARDGFFRDPVAERDVIDWYQCLNRAHALHLRALCRTAGQTCRRRAVIGTFYGYLWPHFNTENPARLGHMELSRVLRSRSIDYLAAPYHYDNRNLGGVHHSQTVVSSVELAGKFFVDEIDSSTHLTKASEWPFMWQPPPKSAGEACLVLRRDGAAALGSPGTGWWMDLHHNRWYADAAIQEEVGRMVALSREEEYCDGPSHAEVALVIDDASAAYCDLHSNLHQYFTTLQRQFAWSDLGFPFDTILLSSLPKARPYRVYVFLNPWYADAARRAMVREVTHRPGVTTLWFYGAGYFGGRVHGAEGVSDLVGMRVTAAPGSGLADVELAGDGDPLLEELALPSTARRFGARLSEEQIRVTIRENPRGWDTVLNPRFAVVDPSATVLGRYVDTGECGLACRREGGRTTLYSAAPMLPGALLRRAAELAGVHLYTGMGGVIHHRGRLLSVYAPKGGRFCVRARPGQRVALLPLDGMPDLAAALARSHGEAREALDVEIPAYDTRFFIEHPAG